MRVSEIAGVLLAAGAGYRMGTPKALIELGGERLVDRGIKLLEEGGCHPVVVVLGAADVPVRGAVAVRNPDWETGMASSLKVGLAAVPGDAAAVVVALVDQPLIRPEAVRRLVEAFHGGASIAVATYGGRPRNPVLFSRAHLAPVGESVTGDAGARDYLRTTAFTAVPCDDVGDPADVDTPDDLAAVEKGTLRLE
ncbi:nucleotidyltransferase family protein [Streptosporangiaceae bacterium NEAU-GS5]|nr:nucleotidyltransferase family protein [Streptosporangiaceae bacterium NEAU-GS5]